MSNYKPLVETIIQNLVEHTDQVRIEDEEMEGTRTFYVHVAPEDVGKVIGRNGRVISAVRCVVSAIAAREQEKAYIKVPMD